MSGTPRPWRLASLALALCAVASCSGDQEIDGPDLGATPGTATLAAPKIGLTPVRGSIPGALVPGLRATAGPEDLVLTGEYGKYIVERTADAEKQQPARAGAAIRPGAVIDAQGARGGQDGLVALTTTLALDKGAQIPVDFGVVRIAEDTRGGAILSEADVTRGEARLRVVTRAVLTRDLPHLVLITDVTNTGEQRVVVRLGDRLQFGAGLIHDGSKGPRKAPGEARTPWVGYEAPGQGYGYTVDGNKPFTAVFHVSERGNKPAAFSVDSRAAPASIASGESTTFVRRFRASSHGLPGVRAWVAELAGLSVGSLRGKIVLPRRLDPDEFVLEMKQGGTLVGAIPVKSSLAFDVSAPAGQYQITAAGPWGLTAPAKQVSINGSTDIPDIKFPPLAELDLEVYDRDNRRLLPATAVVVNAANKPVFLGSGKTASQAGPYFHMPKGGGRLLLPAGRYRLIFTRGTEYDIDVHEIDVRPSREPTAIRAKLRRVMPSPGWVRAGLRNYSNAGTFGVAGPADLAAALACSGIEFAVTADRPEPADLIRGAQEAGLETYLTGVPALEGEPIEPIIGHFVAFPASPDNKRAMILQGTNPKTLLGVLHGSRSAGMEPFVSLVWPRTPSKWGYFDRYGFSKTTGKFQNRSASTEFDGLEVFSGEGLGGADPLAAQWSVVTEWMALVSSGHRATATAASGSKRLGHEPVALPFTYVSVGKKGDKRPSDISRAAVINGLRAHRAVPSTGPLVELSVDGQPAGSTVGGKWKTDPRTKARRWLPHSVRVRVTAADWVGYDRVELYKNGELLKSWEGEGTHKKGLLVFDEKVASTSVRDAWFMVRVTGATPLKIAPHRAVFPHAISNPVWIDANRDGAWKM